MVSHFECNFVNIVHIFMVFYLYIIVRINKKTEYDTDNLWNFYLNMHQNCICIDRLRNQFFSIESIFKNVKIDLRKEIISFFIEMYFQNSRFKISGGKKVCGHHKRILTNGARILSGTSQFSHLLPTLTYNIFH